MKKNPAHKQKRYESGHCRSGSTDMRAVDSGQKGEVKSVTVKMGSEGTVGRQKEGSQNQNNVQLKGKYLIFLCGV